MDKDKERGYISGIFCSLISVVFFLVVLNSKGWNDLSGQVIIIFVLLFGGLGIGSFWKPSSIGQIASKILDGIAKNTREETISNKQSQSNVHGSTQTIASHGGHINQTIVYKSPEDEKKRKKGRASITYV